MRVWRHQNAVAGMRVAKGAAISGKGLWGLGSQCFGGAQHVPQREPRSCCLVWTSGLRGHPLPGQGWLWVCPGTCPANPEPPLPMWSGWGWASPPEKSIFWPEAAPSSHLATERAPSLSPLSWADKAFCPQRSWEQTPRLPSLLGLQYLMPPFLQSLKWQWTAKG